MNSMTKYGTWANQKTDFKKTNKTYRLSGKHLRQRFLGRLLPIAIGIST
jgi:hypothetical protein